MDSPVSEVDSFFSEADNPISEEDGASSEMDGPLSEMDGPPSDAETFSSDSNSDVSYTSIFAVSDEEKRNWTIPNCDCDWGSCHMLSTGPQRGKHPWLHMISKSAMTPGQTFYIVAPERREVLQTCGHSCALLYASGLEALVEKLIVPVVSSTFGLLNVDQTRDQQAR